MNINIVRLFSTSIILENYATKTALTPFLHRRNLGVRKSFRWTKRERGKKTGRKFHYEFTEPSSSLFIRIFSSSWELEPWLSLPPLDVDKLATGIPRAPFRPNKIKSLGRGGGGGGERYSTKTLVYFAPSVTRFNAAASRELIISSGL